MTSMAAGVRSKSGEPNWPNHTFWCNDTGLQMYIQMYILYHLLYLTTDFTLLYFTLAEVLIVVVLDVFNLTFIIFSAFSLT